MPETDHLMMFKSAFIWLFPILMVLVGSTSYAQLTLEKFGKNRIQYKNLRWRYLSSENFDLYFYDGGEEIAEEGIKYLDGEFERITDMLGYAPYTKTRIFLYNSISDLQQSNVGVNESNFSIGGETDFLKSHIEVAYTGLHSQFREHLLYEFSQLLIKDMMFGGSLSDMFQSSYLLSLPDWFIEGAARYIAYGWNMELDDYIRDFFSHDDPKKLNRYAGVQAGLIGHSVWNFISEKYGQSTISNILNLTRIIRNEEKSIATTLGVPFKDFISEWAQFYIQNKEHVDKYYWKTDPEKIKIKSSRDLKYNKIKASPDGQYLAYSQNLRGKYKVKVLNLKNNRTEVALTGGYRAINQKIDENLPLVSWIDNTNLAIVNNRYGSNFIWFYNIQSNRRQKKELTRISNIKDFDISESGNLAVISADLNGKNDLFLISLRRNSIKRLTNDIFDDNHPQFVPGSSAIIFSSNRLSDSLSVSRKMDIKNLSNIYNLYIYDIDTTRDVLYRVTNTLSRNTMPIPVSEHEYYYLSDQQGINNLYKFDITKKIYTQITRYPSGILNYDIFPNKQGFTYSLLYNKRQNIFYDPQFDLNDDTFSMATKRQEINNAKFVAQKIRKKQETPVDTTNQFTLQIEIPPVAREDTVSADTTLKKPADLEFIDTDNYVFDREVIKEAEKKESFLSQYRKFRRESEVMGPFDYETLFSASNIVTSFVIDPMLGFGIQLETRLNDLLEDNKFYGGVLATTDLKSGSLFGEYQFLKSIVDFNVRYDRESIYRQTEASSQKYTLNKFEVGASLPLSVTSRISLKPFYAHTRYYDLDPLFLITPPPSTATSSSINYGGFKTEFVFDNTVINGLNLIEGTRSKIAYSMYEGLNNHEKSFGNFYVDLRNYQKIHRELVFATRVYYGRFFGQNKQNYLLGGVDNWLFNSTEVSGTNDPLVVSTLYDNSNLLFVEYITNLRGFNYNVLNGSNSLLVNAELRFPVVRYFYRGPISSNFFRNLLLTGFFDIGSAWTGKSPFATENSVNTEIIANPGSPFQAKILNFRNPWLSSYGFGIRTVLLGYYVRFDLAYPIDDYEIGKPRPFVSLGYDF